ncbi:MAG: DNA-binding protein, partial [Humibacillus sp.]|nr:DNA-binding protein [Humibacillus sp.]
MQDLTLIGVHEDGAHLLLADADGARYVVPLDESLRSAVRADRARPHTLTGQAAEALRPAAVQALIRSGLGAEEVADRAGWTVEKVHRYEGPILAEREHVASLARAVRLRSRGGAHGAAATLDTRVGERLRTREIDGAAVSWDSRRVERGDWVVSLSFNAGGRRREATWAFDPLARTVAPLDDESRWLSEDDDSPAPGPLAAPHISAPSRPSRVYDVEAEGGVGASSLRGRPSRPGRPARQDRSTPASPAAATGAGGATGTSRPAAADPAQAEGGTPLDLVAAMRQRNAQRGRR